MEKHTESRITEHISALKQHLPFAKSPERRKEILRRVSKAYEGVIAHRVQRLQFKLSELSELTKA